MKLLTSAKRGGVDKVDVQHSQLLIYGLRSVLR